VGSVGSGSSENAQRLSLHPSQSRIQRTCLHGRFDSLERVGIVDARAAAGTGALKDIVEHFELSSHGHAHGHEPRLESSEAARACVSTKGCAGHHSNSGNARNASNGLHMQRRRDFTIGDHLKRRQFRDDEIAQGATNLR
jgi:hypothetical protein